MTIIVTGGACFSLHGDLLIRCFCHLPCALKLCTKGVLGTDKSIWGGEFVCKSYFIMVL